MASCLCLSSSSISAGDRSRPTNSSTTAAESPFARAISRQVCRPDRSAPASISRRTHSTSPFVAARISAVHPCGSDALRSAPYHASTERTCACPFQAACSTAGAPSPSFPSGLAPSASSCSTRSAFPAIAAVQRRPGRALRSAAVSRLRFTSWTVAQPSSTIAKPAASRAGTRSTACQASSHAFRWLATAALTRISSPSAALIVSPRPPGSANSPPIERTTRCFGGARRRCRQRKWSAP
eukprot:COSAG04_NODE_93_length_26686_cov_10.174364_25_plen_238_part_01